MKPAPGRGFTLIEMLMVLVILGILFAIAVPWYGRYHQQTQAAECLANRRHMELEGAADYLQTGQTSLNIDPRYRCPSGGVYVWQIDPLNPDHPRVICSIHGGADTGGTNTDTGTEDEGNQDQSQGQGRKGIGTGKGQGQIHGQGKGLDK